MCEKYNGWTNYETWAVKLWMDNDEGSYNYWNERTEELYEEAVPAFSFTSKRDAARVALMDELKETHEENAPENEASIYTDLMSAALGSVDWHEIAESLLAFAFEREAIEA